MEKQMINCLRSRAKAEVHSHGGRVVGWHDDLPVIYAFHPLCEPLWPVTEVVKGSGVNREVTRTSYIDGCTVIWR